MGLSPWKTRHQLWAEKLGKLTPKDNSYILQKGHILEDRARVLYELTYDMDIPPKVVRHKDYSFAQVSLDGLNLEAKKVVEIKYVGELVFDKVKKDGYIPEHYYPQLQYQLFCTGFSDLDFVAYSEKRDKITVVSVPVNIDYIVNMVASVEEFVWEVKNQMPPRLVEKDYKKIIKATIRRNVEALKKLLVSEYPDKTHFHWDGIRMEIMNEEKSE